MNIVANENEMNGARFMFSFDWSETDPAIKLVCCSPTHLHTYTHRHTPHPRSMCRWVLRADWPARFPFLDRN